MACKAENIKMHRRDDKKNRKVLNNLKPGWVAPDGGWGWIIVAAAGLCNVFIAPLVVCFGLVFRERLQQFGISTSQTTTILNVHAAVGSFAGLMNGPLFRKYTFRQGACVAAFVISVSICMLAFMKTFYGLFFFYSILYGSGNSIAMSASSLTLISYFTKKRRIGVGISWAFSGLAHIVTPQVATLLMSIYGAFGTIILFGGIALHGIVCAVLLQPVQMNAKRSTEYENIKSVAKEDDEKSTNKVIDESKIILPMEIVRNRGKYDDHNRCLNDNNEEIELTTPLMTCKKENGESNDDNSWKQKNGEEINGEAQVQLTKTFENLDDIKNHSNKVHVVHENDDKIKYLLEKDSTQTCGKVEDQKQKKLSWWSDAFRAVVAFFDLDLLRDCAFVNIMIGVSLVFVIEVNYILLTPFIFADYGLTDSQTSIMMSIGGVVDVLTRITVSVVATRIGWENRTFMFIGVGISALGHAALAHVNTYTMFLGVVIICSMGKGICLVFSALVVPDYVSLEKLPAATGLQLMTRGIFFLSFGPVIGWIREISGSYAIPLHFLNIFSYYIIISGFIEGRCCSSSKRPRPEETKEARV